MAARTSGGRDEIAASALRRSFNARRDSSNDSISASMACCKRSREFAWVAYIEKLVVWCKEGAIIFARHSSINRDRPPWLASATHEHSTMITPKKCTTELMSMGRHFTGVECSYVRTLDLCVRVSSTLLAVRIIHSLPTALYLSYSIS